MFRNWVLQNFPFLENDFDALTDYELFCKMMEYVKKFAEDVDEFKIELEKYENYFKNLDVQEEIDNKLDEMVEDGTLDDIINQQIFGVLNSRVAACEYQIELNREQIHFKKYDLVFDVTNAEVGDLVTTTSTNDVPILEGYTIIGFLPVSATYPDANFMIATDISNNKIYSILELGFKGTDTEINGTGYIVYAKTPLIDPVPVI